MTDTRRSPRLTLRGAAFLGIGAMVGAGIFALLGEAGAVAGPALWLSFLLGGIVAALLSYTVAKLGARYPSSGGLIAYMTEAFGGSYAGVFSWLLYFAAIIVTSMVAVSFGNYAAALFIGDAGSSWAHVFTTAAIIRVATINIIGTALIDRVQLGHPGFGPNRIAAELARPKWAGIRLSPNGVWQRCAVTGSIPEPTPGPDRRVRGATRTRAASRATGTTPRCVPAR
jgi:hypothetical protein